MQIDETENNHCQICIQRNNDKIKGDKIQTYQYDQEKEILMIEKQISDMEKQEASIYNLMSCLQQRYDKHGVLVEQANKAQNQAKMMWDSESKRNQQLKQLKKQIQQLEQQYKQQICLNQELSLKIYDQDKQLMKQCNDFEKQTQRKAISSATNQLRFQKLSEQYYRLTHSNILEMLFALQIHQNKNTKTNTCYINCQQLNKQNLWKTLPALQYIFHYGCPKLHERKYVTVIDMQNQIIIVVKDKLFISNSPKQKQTSQATQKKTKSYEQIMILDMMKWLPYVMNEILNFKQSVNEYSCDALSQCEELVTEIMKAVEKMNTVNKKYSQFEEHVTEKLVRVIVMLFKWIQEFSGL